MSGISPLIDTLLHQVLGRREPQSVASELNREVRPLTPAEALRPLHSDSRLDPRLTQANAGISASATGLSASIHTHLSPAALTIARLLNGEPTLPGVIRPPLPLMAAQPLSAAELAQRLELGIRDSGLFYESHLARWFRGEWPRARLEQEPQMRQEAMDLADNTSMDEGATLDEGLQALVRHQLELLVTPTLRWESQAWPGCLMALLIQPPETGYRPESGAEPQDEAEGQGWRSELTLQHGDFGEIRISVWLQGERLAITLAPEAEIITARLQADLERIRPRLAACGFREVSLHIGTVERQTHE
ncbi:flagellar hook-length control protein FliK [Oceanisphaera arctica]|uniref:Flagellar hook-length control protein-like C-terminal domain-containing protein n=1 Tax=Oceanisphaera arctica TaxID=641510 RepID=A0A2P5TMQ5_9GAMM|nr:flagellar hook-length control protein FliK [Oceanisphaera arctica]PPL16739.1 hypothetical protein UN63_07375 [Oceanisphaera arctica]GHA06189.1 hypothetical protein GCM10007082_03990 [Oceanisphaera arctica]